MLKTFVLALLVALAFGRTYPMYKQCDSRWANEQLGTSSNTICKAGCAMSSVAMGLAGTGHNYNPSTLNHWLKANGGYVGGDNLVWGSVTRIGLTFEGKFSNSHIKSALDQGKVVVCNVHNGGHWVLAHGYSGDNILVNDPGYSTSSYSLSQIVNGQTAVYTLNKLPSFWNNILLSAKETINTMMGVEQKIEVQERYEATPEVNVI